MALGNNEIKKRKFHCCKHLILLGDVDINKTLISSIISSIENIINTLLVTKMLIMELNHYSQCFQTGALM